jgi:hypothetical protein
MEPGPGFYDAMNNLEGPLYELADALDGLLASGRISLRESGTSTVPLVERYATASYRVWEEIRGERSVVWHDNDRLARASASIGMDFRFAMDLALLTQAEPLEDAEPDDRPVRIEDTGGDHDHGITRTEAEELKYVIADGERAEAAYPSTAPPPPPDPDPPSESASGGDESLAIVKSIDEILRNGGGAMAKTVSQAIVGPVLPSLVQDLNTILGPAIVEMLDQAVKKNEGKWWKAFSSCAAKLLDSAMTKIRELIGEGVLLKAIDPLKRLLPQGLQKVGGGMLGWALDRDELVQACNRLLTGKPHDIVRNAEKLCDEVAKANKKRMSHLNWANVALGVGATHLRLLGGDILIAAIAVTLIVYVLYLTHDHLDSSALRFLPDHDPGIRTRVKEAVS